MKKVFIVLLIAAAGAVVYYLLRNKPNSVTANANQKELILGKWKIDSLDFSRSKDSSGSIIALLILGMDSNAHKYEFNFQKNGVTIEGMPNAVNTDTTQYEWIKYNQLLVWESDTTKTAWSILKLDSTNFIAQSSDSIIYYFKR